MASIPWDMSKGNLDLDDLYLRTNSPLGVLPHELPPLSGPVSSKSGLGRGKPGAPNVDQEEGGAALWGAFVRDRVLVETTSPRSHSVFRDALLALLWAVPSAP